MRFEPDVSDATRAFIQLFFDDPVPLKDVVAFVKEGYPDLDPFEVYKDINAELEVMYMRWDDE